MIDNDVLRKLSDRNWRIDSGMYKILTVKSDAEMNEEEREQAIYGKFALKEVPYRRNLIQKYLDNVLHPRVIIPKARQLGITTHASIDTLDMAMFNKNYKAAIVANTGTLVKTLFQDKIIYPYSNPGMKDLVNFPFVFPYKSKTTSNIIFDHPKGESEISVRTAATGLTLNKLHISELGKLDQDYPEKARELIRTSLPALHPGARLTIESTADAGPRGEFYRICSDSAELQKNGISPGPDDFVMVFFGWYLDPNYRIFENHRPLPKELRDYFKELEGDHRIFLDDDQKQFYYSKYRTLGSGVFRQFPSTWKECFSMDGRGIIYAEEMNKVDMDRRIDDVPIKPELLVDTWWDLGTGRSDQCAIWFTQSYPNGMIAVVDYMEGALKGMQYYSRELQQKPYTYGYHVGPWDLSHPVQGANGLITTQWQLAANLGIKFKVAPKMRISDGIEMVRNLFPRLVFDRNRCATLINRLRNYRYHYDEDKQMFVRTPVHDINSHCCDAGRVLGTTHDYLMLQRAKNRSKKKAEPTGSTLAAMT